VRGPGRAGHGSILFRTIKLRKARPAAPKPARPPQPEPDTTFLPAPIHQMSSQELRRALKSLAASTAGSKAVLRDRLDKIINGDRR